MNCDLCIFKNSDPDLCMNAEARIDNKGCMFGCKKEPTDNIKRCILCGGPTTLNLEYCEYCLRREYGGLKD